MITSATISSIIIHIYVSAAAVILGGISNMLFTKTKIYEKYRIPIDFGKTAKDGYRIFGNNKTFIGFFSMMIFCLIWQVIVGAILAVTSIDDLSWWYISGAFSNTVFDNAIIGLLLGFFYMVFELPNSFVKRRLNIAPGASGQGYMKYISFATDQFDSMLGIFLLMFVITRISVFEMLLGIFVGALTHVMVNMLLRAFKIRKTL